VFFGLFSNSIDKYSGIELDHLKSLMDINQLLCREVSMGNYRGGFLQNPQFPYKVEDYLFQDDSLDIIVLISGSIYNNYELSKKCPIALM